MRRVRRSRFVAAALALLSIFPNLPLPEPARLVPVAQAAPPRVQNAAPAAAANSAPRGAPQEAPPAGPLGGPEAAPFEAAQPAPAAADSAAPLMADVTGTITIGGPAVTVGITTAGQKGILTFSGTALQRVSLRLTNSTIGDPWGGASVSLLDPDGTTLASAGFGTSGTYMGQ